MYYLRVFWLFCQSFLNVFQLDLPSGIGLELIQPPHAY